MKAHILTTGPLGNSQEVLKSGLSWQNCFEFHTGIPCVFCLFQWMSGPLTRKGNVMGLKGINSGVRLPEFKSQLCDHEQVVFPCVPHFLIYKMELTVALYPRTFVRIKDHRLWLLGPDVTRLRYYHFYFSAYIISCFPLWTREI